MANPAHIAAHDPDVETGHDTDDEPILTTPHRELVAELGKLASAEQRRLERELGRPPRPRQD
jgi:hypothetical protein